MNCTALLKRSEQKLIAGNTTAEDAAAELIGCFPQVCDQVFGDAGFELAGSGVYISIVIQVVLFVVFGTLQAYLSQCIPTRASVKTQLILARFQTVHDTVYSTGSFFSLALLITCYIRTSQDHVGPLEKSVMRDIVESQNSLQNLAMAAYLWIQVTPPKIKRSAQSWGHGSVYLVYMGLGLLVWTIKQRLDKMPTSGAEMAPKLCSSLYDYPHLHTGMSASGLNPLLVGTALGLLLLIGGVGMSLLLPQLWSWMAKVFGSRLFKATSCILFSALGISCLVWETMHLYWTRKDLEGLPQWDLAQVSALLLWIRPAWHIILATLRMMGPEKSAAETSWWQNALGMLYTSNFEEPSIEEDEPEKSGQPEEPKNQSHLEDFPGFVKEVDEKAQLVDDTADERPRSPSPGQLV